MASLPEFVRILIHEAHEPPMLRKTTFSFFMIAILTLIGTEQAYACSCLMPEGPISKLVGEAKQSSHSIFSGKVVKITENPDAQKFQDQYISVELRVIDIWKGTLGKTVTIRTGSHDGNCRFPFKVNQTYLIYAENSTMYSPTEMLSTGICSRTTLYAKGKQDIRYLGKSKKPA